MQRNEEIEYEAHEAATARHTRRYDRGGAIQNRTRLIGERSEECVRQVRDDLKSAMRQGLTVQIAPESEQLPEEEVL